MNVDVITEQAKGRWPFIFESLGLLLRTDGHHGPCPICGGKDRFRFDDRGGRGTWFCNQCSPQSGDGFALVMKRQDWSFLRTAKEVAAVLDVGVNSAAPESRPALATVSTTPPAGTLGVDLFVYQDATGQAAIYVKRTDLPDGQKRFCQWGPTRDTTGWQRNLQHAPKPRPVYHLPSILASTDAVVLFHEGEKATEAAISAGLPGIHVTTLGGARSARHSDFSPVRGRQVVVCPDHDPDGFHYAAEVERLALQAGALSVNVVQFTGVPPSGDVVEWLAAGGTPTQFSELITHKRASIFPCPSGPGGPSGRVQPQAAELSVGAALSFDLGPATFPPVDGYRIESRGVFERAKAEDKPDIQLTLTACGVLAHCRDGRRENWGAFVRWIDRDGMTHEAAYPIGRFHEPAGTLAAELANLGLPIVPGMERRLLRYFAQCTPKTRFRAAIQTGWQDDSTVFVLPGESIGEIPAGERVVYQPERNSPTRQSVRPEGSFLTWQREVAACCEGHPVLAFLMAAAFAAPLLSLLKQEGGGFHLYGLTSKGKTTALQVAASVWGDGSDPAAGRSTTFVRKWNLTKNATEGLAEAHTDLPLCLDEVGEADAREFGRMIYQLAGGQGKARMSADAWLLKPKAWKVLLLSTGELPASEVIESQGKTMKGGQAVRLIDLPATDPVTGEGIVTDTHCAAESGDFVDRLKDSCTTHYGWAGPAFIRGLVTEGLAAVTSELQAAWKDITEALTPQNSSPEVQRAVKRFALVAVAGEKALSLGILPWQPGEAVRRARDLFTRYLAARGGAGSELEQGIERVKAFLLTHGSSRFRELSREEDRIFNLAGYRDERNEFFYLTPDGFKEACGGHDRKEVARLLHARGLLDAPDTEAFTRRVTVRGVGRIRLYAISTEIFESVPDVERHRILDRSMPGTGPS